MSDDVLNQITSFIRGDIRCFLAEDLDMLVFEDCVIIDLLNKEFEFNGHYEGIEFVKPEWLVKLENAKNKVLVLDNFNKISNDKQKKFVELFKYNQIGSFELPDEAIIFAVTHDLEKGELDEEASSLLTHL